MHTIAFLGLPKISAVLIVLIIAALIAAFGAAKHGMYERALELLNAAILMSVALMGSIAVLVVLERRRNTSS